jgi:hypothetical protein
MTNQKLFEYMLHEHGVTLLVGDMHEIERIVMEEITPPPGIESLIKRVEGLKLDDPNYDETRGYNLALVDVLEILRSTPVIKAKALRADNGQFVMVDNIMLSNMGYHPKIEKAVRYESEQLIDIEILIP